MVFRISFLVLAPVLLSVSACSSMFGDHGVFRGKSKDYLRTASLRPIDVPEDMTARSLEPLYAIPQVNPVDEFGDSVVLEEYEVPLPGDVNTEKGTASVKIQKLSGHRWIFLNASTSQVWPRTQNFLSQLGLSVAVSDPSRGLIETGSVGFKDAPDMKSRFRIFIEKGVHPETTEIHIKQVEFPKDEIIAEDFSWPKKSMNADREKLLLDELANVLAQNVSNNAASLLGQNVGGNLKVEFAKSSGEPAMRLRLIPQRAKATVAHALGREGFYLWEEYGDTGLFYVGYHPKFDGDPGWWDKIRGRSLPKEGPYPIAKLLKHLDNRDDVKNRFARFDAVSFDAPLPKTRGYLVLVDPLEEGAEVIVRDAQGRPLPAPKAKNLLRIIRRNLI